MDASARNEMIAIPPGQVTLSDRRTQHRWRVELAPYQLAAFPITQAHANDFAGPEFFCVGRDGKRMRGNTICQAFVRARNRVGSAGRRPRHAAELSSGVVIARVIARGPLAGL
jgi:hypothetical protein